MPCSVTARHLFVYTRAANSAQSLYQEQGFWRWIHRRIRGSAGPGNISADPCFACPGHWAGPRNTPGNPNSDWTGELSRHSKRINIGALGGTPEGSLSRSDFGSIADLDNDPNYMVNFVDFALFTSRWKTRELLLAAVISSGCTKCISFFLFLTEASGREVNLSATLSSLPRSPNFRLAPAV